MILPLAVFSQLAVACAPQVAPETLTTVAQIESQLDPLAIGDNTAHRSYHPHKKAEAVDLARQLMAEGHILDVGLMQVNQRNWNWLGLTLEDAVDPCRSIAAGATVLTAFSSYNTGSPSRGFVNGYVARVVAAASDIKLPQARNNVVTHHEDPSQGPGVKQNGWNVFPDEDPSSQQSFGQSGDYHEQN